MELINRLGCDPMVVFSPAEVRAELQRWNQEAPPRGQEEAEPEYLQRLRLVSGSHTHTHQQTWKHYRRLLKFSRFTTQFNNFKNKMESSGSLNTETVQSQTTVMRSPGHMTGCVFCRL